MNFLKGSPNWEETDTVVYEAMYSGSPFKNMQDKQQSLAITGMIFKTGVISGCPLPTDKTHRKELSIETQKFMSENKDFAKMTFEEILTAFRFNAAGLLAGYDKDGNYTERVKHWQNMFNLEYLGEVLSRYVLIKNKVKLKAEKQLMMKNLMDEYTCPDLPESEVIQFSENEWNRTKDYMFIESRAYDLLCKKGEIKLTPAEKKQIMYQAQIKIDIICHTCQGMFGFNGNPSIEALVAKKIAAAQYFNGGPLDSAERPSIARPAEPGTIHL